MNDYFGELIVDIVYFALWLIGYYVAGILPFSYTQNLRKQATSVMPWRYASFKQQLNADNSRAQLAILGTTAIAVLIALCVGLKSSLFSRVPNTIDMGRIVDEIDDFVD